MGMIRVSDHAEQIIRDYASLNEISLTSAVELLVSKEQKEPSVDMAAVMKKLDEIQALIEDTAVDRLDKGAGKTSSPSTTTYLDWADVREMMFDWAEDADWSSSAAKKGMEESNLSDEAKWTLDESGVWGNFYGDEQLYLELTPHIAEFLKGKGYEL